MMMNLSARRQAQKALLSHRRNATSSSGRRSLSSLTEQKSESNTTLSQQDGRADRLLVIGSGVAGSAAALIAAELHRMPVTMIFAGNLATDCNSYWAQGGIIYRNYDPSVGDSASLLAHDIRRAGAGLCQDDAVNKVSEEGPDRIRQLLLDASGTFAQVPFDRQASATEDDPALHRHLSLCLEASHSAARILHKADHTGRTITQHLTMATARHPLIEMVPRTVVTDLVVQDDHCVGVQTLDRNTGQFNVEYASRGVVLASGGLGGIYEHSTNPAGFNALGSSVAMAARQGVECQDLEYVQFHPTALYVPNESRFLLTEALRGEGAVLRDSQGRAFARDYHPDGELAPRDVVARAVFKESQKETNKPVGNHQHNVFLDITHRDGKWLHERFPSIQEHLSGRGLDLARDPLPITPAAHYTCGGITTDLQGRTSLKGLFAAGEAARTGLHGGNRLASTSLLEGLVFGASVADYCGSDAGLEVREQATQVMAQNPSPPLPHQAARDGALEPGHIEHASHRAMELLNTLRRTMWDYVGVVRTPRGLETALDSLRDTRDEVEDLHATMPTLETVVVRDAAHAGYAVAEAAYTNRQSAGAHCLVEDAEDDGAYSDEEEAPAVAGAIP